MSPDGPRWLRSNYAGDGFVARLCYCHGSAADKRDVIRSQTGLRHQQKCSSVSHYDKELFSPDFPYLAKGPLCLPLLLPSYLSNFWLERVNPISVISPNSPPTWRTENKAPPEIFLSTLNSATCHLQLKGWAKTIKNLVWEIALENWDRENKGLSHLKQNFGLLCCHIFFWSLHF